MYPELHLGPVTMQTFGICFALAFIGAGALVWKRFVELGKPPEWGYEMGFAALIGGLARLGLLARLPQPEAARRRRSASWSSFCAETRAVRWDLPPPSWSLC
jgi:hypothetical protein